MVEENFTYAAGIVNLIFEAVLSVTAILSVKAVLNAEAVLNWEPGIGHEFVQFSILKLLFLNLKIKMGKKYSSKHGN